MVEVKEKKETLKETESNSINQSNDRFCPCGEFINLETGLKNDFTGFRPGGASE